MPYKTAFASEKFVRTVASRVQTLKDLVLESRGLELPVFFQETAACIESLQMHVRAMQELTDWYSNICALACKV